MDHWTPSACRAPMPFDADRLVSCWSRLHGGDAEPLPNARALLEAWSLFHNGDFEQAAQAGMSIGGAGITLANHATCIHATYVEPSERRRLDLLMEVAERAEAQQRSDPANPNAWYWHAYALGRFSQGVSVAKGLAQGLGGRIVGSLRETLRLAPEHPNAHLALARFHAEVLDKVGDFVGGITYGASRSEGLALYRRALELYPDSLITLHECATGWLMLDADFGLVQAERLREQAEGLAPFDAMECLYLDEVREDLEG